MGTVKLNMKSGLWRKTRSLKTLKLSHFRPNWAEIFYGSSGDHHYLSMKIRVMNVIFYFRFFGPLWRENGRSYHARP